MVGTAQMRLCPPYTLPLRIWQSAYSHRYKGSAETKPQNDEDRVTQAVRKTGSNAAPVAPRRPHSFTNHGITIVADYAWLKDANWQEGLPDPGILNPDIREDLEASTAYTR